MATKSELRNEFKLIRKNLDANNRKVGNKKITQTTKEIIEAHKDWKRIALYFSDSEEVDTANLIDWALSKKYEVYLPRVEVSNKTMTFHRITPNWRNERESHPTLEIFEPQAVMNLGSRELDVVVLPLVAFDNSLNRLGRGAGYYDRWLKTLNYQPFKIGLAYQVQASSKQIPADQHDQTLDLVVTDLQKYEVNKRKI